MGARYIKSKQNMRDFAEILRRVFPSNPPEALVEFSALLQAVCNAGLMVCFMYDVTDDAHKSRRTEQLTSHNP
jgi:hypothetical protein